MINSSNLIDKNTQRFRRLALLTVVTVYLLILAGGIVRGTGSGMGCPDWPKCFGQWIPPTDIAQLPPNYQEIYGAKLKGEIEFNPVKTWIEYVNRLLGVLSGFLVFATLVASVPFLRKNQSIFWGSLAAFLLIGVNGWLGSRVVATELAQYLITLHLALAILVVFALLFVLVRANAANEWVRSNITPSKGLKWLLLLTMGLSLAQILLGAQVRDALNDVIQRIGYSQRDTWISNLDWRFYVHRSFSLVVLGLHLWLVYRLRKVAQSRMMSRLIVALLLMVLAEIGTGIVMAYLSVPASAQPVHLFLAVLMIGLQFVIWLLLYPGLNAPSEYLTPLDFKKFKMDKLLSLTGIQIKAKAYIELVKLKLTLAVVFSGVFGYCLAADTLIWWKLAVLIVASISITGAANVINQIIEKESDKVMKRTAGRPLPTGRLTVREAATFAFILFGIACFLFIEVFNIRAAALAVLSLLLYGFVYTPLKTKGQVAVWIGALPGCFSANDWMGCSYQSFWLGTRYFVCHSIFLAIPALLGHWLAGI
jgi:cytochrome c oxidase assembly protein subunit 15